MGEKVLGVLGTYSFLHILILYGEYTFYFPLYPLIPQAKISVEEGTVVPPHLDGCFHIPEWYDIPLKNGYITLIELNRWAQPGALR